MNGSDALLYTSPDQRLPAYVCEFEAPPCPPGHACPRGSNAVILCPAGTYSTGNAAACDVCPAGTYSAPGASHCVICANDNNGMVTSCASDSGYGRQECSAASLAQPWVLQATNRSDVVSQPQICLRHLFGTPTELTGYVCATELQNSTCATLGNGCCAPGSVGVPAKGAGDWIVGTIPSALASLSSLT